MTTKNSKKWLILIGLIFPLSAARAAPEDWQVRQGRWKIAGEELISEGKGYSSLVFRRGAPLQNFDLSVEVLFPVENSSAGVIFRHQGNDFYHRDTFYQFEWYATGRHHSQRLSLLVKNTPWRWKQLVTPRLSPPPLNKWIKFRLRAVDEKIECYIDGEKVFTATDRSFVRPGAIALHSFMPAPAQYRNLRVTPVE